MDPVTGVHMNSIEGTWTHAKKLKPRHKRGSVWVVLGGVHVEEEIQERDPFRTPS